MGGDLESGVDGAVHLKLLMMDVCTRNMSS